MADAARVIAIATLLIAGAVAYAQSMYKYQDEDGSWIYSDRAPPDQQSVEVLAVLDKAIGMRPAVRQLV